MWVRLTYTKMNPDKIAEARALYNSEMVSGVISQQKGYCFHHLLESTDNPGEAISLTAFDNQADGEAYEQSGVYKELVGKFSAYFTAPPELKTYKIFK